MVLGFILSVLTIRTTYYETGRAWYSVLMPVFATKVFHGGPHTLGWLSGASGAGALVSALSLAVRRSADGLSRMVAISLAVLGVALILFGLSRTLWLSLVLML